MGSYVCKSFILKKLIYSLQESDYGINISTDVLLYSSLVWCLPVLLVFSDQRPAYAALLARDYRCWDPISQENYIWKIVLVYILLCNPINNKLWIEK